MGETTGVPDLHTQVLVKGEALVGEQRLYLIRADQFPILAAGNAAHTEEHHRGGITALLLRQQH